jgi:D-alanyl-lipoteichoic acid acyltransferase DltB (MBOAT superfamily)
VIGTGRLLGLALPENFNRPFMARNMIDFWNRWHISLSHWIRDYIFTPLYKNLTSVAPGGARVFGYACLFTALFLAGVWHGSSSTFVIFGLIHGVGVATNRVAEDWIVARYKRAGLRQYYGVPWVRYLAVFITMHYVCLSFLFFRPDLSQNLQIILKVLEVVSW